MALIVSPSGDSLNIKSFGTEYDDQFSGVIETKDGNLAFFGAVSSGQVSDSRDGVLYITDASSALNLEMKKVFGGEKEDYFQSGVQSEEGGFILLGSTKSFGAVQKDCLIIRTNPNGEIE